MGVAASRQEAFWEACGFGHIQRVQKFLETGDIDVNWVSYTHDCCPIHVASQGKTEIVKMLIEAKCNVNVQDIRGNTPVHHAAMKGHADIIKILIEAGAEVNTQDKNNWTALHCAAYWNHVEAVRMLLNHGADVNLCNKDKRTALHETARSQEKDEVKLGEITHMLVTAGSDVNCKGCSDLGDLEADFTGLMYAAYHNHPEVASGLISGGCDINSYGSNLWTALHWAADRGHEEMVYLLLGAGADPTKRGSRNELAADRAEETDLKEILLNAVNMFNELSLLDSEQNSNCEKDLTLLEEKINKTLNKSGKEKINSSSLENIDEENKKQTLYVEAKEEVVQGTKSDNNELESHLLQESKLSGNSHVTGSGKTESCDSEGLQLTSESPVTDEIQKSDKKSSDNNEAQCKVESVGNENFHSSSNKRVKEEMLKEEEEKYQTVSETNMCDNIDCTE